MPRQQGGHEDVSAVASRWGWARVLQRVCAIDMERCPRCQQGTRRINAAIPSRPSIRTMLCYRKLAAEPPLMAWLGQEGFAWVSP